MGRSKAKMLGSVERFRGIFPGLAALEPEQEAVVGGEMETDAVLKLRADMYHAFRQMRNHPSYADHQYRQLGFSIELMIRGGRLIAKRKAEALDLTVTPVSEPEPGPELEVLDTTRPAEVGPVMGDIAAFIAGGLGSGLKDLIGVFPEHVDVMDQRIWMSILARVEQLGYSGLITVVSVEEAETGWSYRFKAY